MPIRRADASWEGSLRWGHGEMRAPHCMPPVDDRLPYSFDSRFRRGEGGNPEEMIGAALAGCYSMALAHQLTQRGFPPKQIWTRARVHLDENANDGFSITSIELETTGDVPAVGTLGFEEEAERALSICPIAKAMETIPIRVFAQLKDESPVRQGD